MHSLEFHLLKMTITMATLPCTQVSKEFQPEHTQTQAIVLVLNPAPCAERLPHMALVKTPSLCHGGGSHSSSTALGQPARMC